jgi:hypothetical protein
MSLFKLYRAWSTLKRLAADGTSVWSVAAPPYRRRLNVSFYAAWSIALAAAVVLVNVCTLAAAAENRVILKLSPDDNAPAPVAGGAPSADQDVLPASKNTDANQPTFITIHKRAALPKDIVAEIARQADTIIATNPNALLNELKDPISLEAEHEPFWKVLLIFCRLTHLTPQESGGIGSRTIILKKGEEPVFLAPPTMNGCFHITPTFTISGGAVANRTILSFRMLVDPKLTVLRSTTFINTIAVADSAGNSLLYKAPFSSDDFTAYYNWYWGLTSHILTPADGNVASFKGTIRTQIVEKSTRWEIDNPLAAKTPTRELPFGKAALTEFSKRDTSKSRNLILYPVYNVSASFDIAPGKEATLGGETVFGGAVRVCDKAGLVSAPAFIGSAKVSGGRADFSTTVSARDANGKNLGEIARMIWEIPSGVREISVPVEFGNISTK